MSTQEALMQYEQALKAGQKYYKTAVHRGEYPYPPALDEIVRDARTAFWEDLGVTEIPVELIVGTRSVGRTASIAGNFMPLMGAESEFAAKWISLCQAHLSDEGLRDPIVCCEYLGFFYVQEGHKRLSVLKSYGAASVSAMVRRLVPAWSEDHDVQVYYEFLQFYKLSRLYGVTIRHRRGYARLQALLGFAPDQVWTEEQRRSFTAGFSRFREAYDKLNAEKLPLTAAEALLVWLQVFPFSDTKGTLAQLTNSLSAVWPDLRARAESEPIEVSTEPRTEEKGLISRLLGTGRLDKVRAAFVYAYDPEVSAWTRSHEHGRARLERAFGTQAECPVYMAGDRDYYAAMEKAVSEGADVIFATTPSMIDACRRIAAMHKDLRVYNCSLSQPYTGVRTYYSRTYESKFITGAVAGAMTAGESIGYIANYPIVGVGADINAFALGVRLTNPRARVKLVWSCTQGDPLRELTEQGITVISNRDATTPRHAHWAMEWGTYRLEPDGALLPLAVPCWNWGEFYERVVRSLLDGTEGAVSPARAVNYWWGLDTGVLDIQFSPALPEGVRALGELLRADVIAGTADPFQRKIWDQAGTLRCDGNRILPPEERMDMDWLCDIVDGRIPAFEELLPQSRELVRQLGLYRGELLPEKEEQL